MPAFAAAIIPTQGGGYSFVEIANLAVAVAILLAGALSLFYIFVGGISFILSGGQEDKIKQAVHTIRYAIIGLVVTFLAIIIVKVVGSVLDMNLVKYLEWSKITEIIERIGNSLSNEGSSGQGTLN